MFLFWLGSKSKNMADNNHITLREIFMCFDNGYKLY